MAPGQWREDAGIAGVDHSLECPVSNRQQFREELPERVAVEAGQRQTAARDDVTVAVEGEAAEAERAVAAEQGGVEAGRVASPPLRPAEQEQPGAPGVIAHLDEDGQAPAGGARQHDLPVPAVEAAHLQLGEGAAQFRQGGLGGRLGAETTAAAQPLRAFSSSMSLGSTLSVSPTMPRSASLKIGASGSLLIATMFLAPFMPTVCCMAPLMPQAM